MSAISIILLSSNCDKQAGDRDRILSTLFTTLLVECGQVLAKSSNSYFKVTIWVSGNNNDD